MTQPDNANPFAAWTGMRDAYLDTWSKMMIDMVNSEAYARATGQLLDGYLTASEPFRQIIESTMTRTLAQLNMPSRDEVTSVAERLTNIEMRLDDLDAKLDELLRELRSRPSPARSSRAKAAE
jgi:hypothetical protein